MIKQRFGWSYARLFCSDFTSNDLISSGFAIGVAGVGFAQQDGALPLITPDAGQWLTSPREPSLSRTPSSLWER